MEILLSIMIGVGLSAACGFRVFVPLFIMSIAASSGHLSLGEEFAWIGSPAAMLALGSASVLEISAYYIPYVDNLLDTIAAPAAVIAGTIATASMVSDMSPLMQWTTGIIAGGGAAAAVQAATTAIRGASTLGTGGIANFAVSTGEAACATCAGILAIISPALAVVLVLVFLAVVALCVRGILRRRHGRAAATPDPAM
jgi:hypothetical protein